MSAQGLAFEVRRHWRQWYWLPILATAAFLATFLLVANARARVEENDRQFYSAQLLRLQEIKIRVDAYFGTATQLVATGAHTVAPVHADPAAVERLVTELFRSRQSQQIYGVGVFYAPRQFDRRVTLFSVYEHVVAGGKIKRELHNPRITSYTHYPWFARAASSKPGEIVFDGPHWKNGRSFISTLQAFHHFGRFAGVVTVDTLTDTFRNENMMARDLLLTDVAWVESDRPGRLLLGTAPLPPGSERIDQSIPLRYAGAYVRLSSSAEPLRAADHGIVSDTAALACAVWLFAALLGAALVQNWGSRGGPRELETGFLESELATIQSIVEESDLANDLRRAIASREFVPFYQPIVDIRSRESVSFEALVRWDRPGHGIVDASDFIGKAERLDLAGSIDDSMLENICDDAPKLFARYPEATVAVNMSAARLTTPDVAATIDRVLRSRAVAPQRLKLEITDNAIMPDPGRVREMLEGLRDAGFQIVLHTLGAGHSSLAYLHRLPIVGIKIDGLIVARLENDEHAVALVRRIVALAQTLRLDTVAQGVENAEQLAILRKLGVLHAQGFLFSPAVPLGTLLTLRPRVSARG
jgi:EAL domain-containing protein (putative c-di-GMP-specific phosphodiesterase class I)